MTEINRFIRPDNSPQAAAFVASRRKEASSLVKGELVKNDDQKKVIKAANTILTNEFAQLQLPFNPIPENEIHLLSHDNFVQQSTDTNSPAQTDPMTRAIFIDADAYEGNPLVLFKFLLHEAGHRAGPATYWWDQTDNRARSYRFGYQRVDTFDPKSQNDGQFLGFNEAIVELQARDLFEEHADEVIQELHLPKEKQIFVTGYDHEVEILEAIIEKCADVTGTPPQETWDQLRQGYYAGDMLSLRVIEESFGNGSLRLLSALDSAYDVPDEAINAHFLNA